MPAATHNLLLWELQVALQKTVSIDDPNPLALYDFFDTIGQMWLKELVTEQGFSNFQKHPTYLKAPQWVGKKMTKMSWILLSKIDYWGRTGRVLPGLDFAPLL